MKLNGKRSEGLSGIENVVGMHYAKAIAFARMQNRRSPPVGGVRERVRICGPAGGPEPLEPARGMGADPAGRARSGAVPGTPEPAESARERSPRTGPDLGPVRLGFWAPQPLEKFARGSVPQALRFCGRVKGRGGGS